MDDARQQRRLQRIQDKGWEIAQRIARIKAGENIRLGDMRGLLKAPPGETEEEKLRAWLDAINRARDRFHSGEYGACRECDKAIREEALDEIPWAEVCGACGSR